MISIAVSGLTYAYDDHVSCPVLSDINFTLPAGSRTLLVGANGAGKSTLLLLLAGKRLISSSKADVRVLGRDVFRQSPQGVTFLGTDWSGNPHSPTSKLIHSLTGPGILSYGETSSLQTSWTLSGATDIKSEEMNFWISWMSISTGTCTPYQTERGVEYSCAWA